MKSNKMICLLLASALVSQLGTFPVQAAKSKTPKIAVKTAAVTKGKTKTVAVKNVTKKIKISFRQNVKSKKIVKVTWQKKNKKIKIKGLKKGTTTILVRFKKGRKTYSSKLKISVRYNKTAKATATITSNAPTSTPDSTPTIIPAPTATPNTMPTAVPTPAGTPLPTYTGEYSGDDVTPIKDIYSKYFMMGAALNGSSLNTIALKHKGMTGILQKHFNSTVLSNLMKPSMLLDETASKASADGMPVCKFDTCDSALQFCRDNGIKMRGHTLIWHNQTPEWLFFEDFDTSKELVDADTMSKRMESFIRQVITHCQTYFPGVVYCWDVVNECVCTDANSYIVTSGGWKLRASTLSDNDNVHDTPISNYWYATMGESYVEKAFTYARKYADNGVTLFYNDYNVFQTEKMNNIYMMVKELKEKGIIDGIGLQPTVQLTYPALNSDSSGSFKTCLEKYAELGLEIQITELCMEIKSPAPTNAQLNIQANRYQEFMELLLLEDSDNGGPCNITSVTVFGICDDYPLYTDSHQNLYLWDKNCVPKPCFYSYIQPGLSIQAQ